MRYGNTNLLCRWCSGWMPLLVRYVIELAPLCFEGHVLSFRAQATTPRLSVTVMRTFPHTGNKEE